MKFKIGDKVKIINHDCINFCGLVGTIAEIHGCLSENIKSNSVMILVQLDKVLACGLGDPIRYVECHENQVVKLPSFKDTINSVYGRKSKISYRSYYKNPDSRGTSTSANNDKSIPKIKNVYFNDPLTIVIWEDGTKTFVKNADGDAYYDPEKALAMAISKKALGNKYHYYKEFEKWLPETEEEASMEKLDKALLALATINAMLPKSNNSSNPVERAYRILMEVNDNPSSTEADFAVAIEAAIGYLGEALDE